MSDFDFVWPLDVRRTWADALLAKVYVWLGWGAVDVCPSPKSHRKGLVAMLFGMNVRSCPLFTSHPN
jgi:hypothetical protein